MRATSVGRWAWDVFLLSGGTSVMVDKRFRPFNWMYEKGVYDYLFGLRRGCQQSSSN